MSAAVCALCGRTIVQGDAVLTPGGADNPWDGVVIHALCKIDAEARA